MCGLNDNTFLMCHIEGVIIHSSAGFSRITTASTVHLHPQCDVCVDGSWLTLNRLSLRQIPVADILPEENLSS